MGTFEDRKKVNKNGQPVIENARRTEHPQQNYDFSEERGDVALYGGSGFNVKKPKLSEKGSE